LATLACLALAASAAKGILSQSEIAEHTHALRHVPQMLASFLNKDKDIEQIGREIAEAQDVLYLGRGSLYPMALEGALKLKEISYIHAEGYAAGEMKHGPIALIDDTVPIVVLAPNDKLLEKTASNVQETVARGGKVLLFTDNKGAQKLSSIAKWVVTMDEIHSFVAPIVYALPIQLLAYHTAVAKGTDVDQPRNLAKSVTVE
jgi:glutamine---fructose-6-phosphate transaminase (isomerizing)